MAKELKGRGGKGAQIRRRDNVETFDISTYSDDYKEHLRRLIGLADELEESAKKWKKMLKVDMKKIEKNRGK